MIAAEKGNLPAIPFSPKRILKRAGDLFGLLAARKEINLVTLLDDSVPEAMVGDPEVFKELCHSVLELAVQSLDSGKIACSAASQSYPDGNVLLLEVHVTGHLSCATRQESALPALVELAGKMGGIAMRQEKSDGVQVWSAILPYRDTIEEGRSETVDPLPLPVSRTLDLEEGLLRAGGDRELYSRLLRNYLTEYGDAPASLIRELGPVRLQAAQHLIHGIKGMAGQLGGCDLRDASRELENALQEAESQIRTSLEGPLHRFLKRHESFGEVVRIILQNTAAEFQKPEPQAEEF